MSIALVRYMCLRDLQLCRSWWESRSCFILQKLQRPYCRQGMGTTVQLNQSANQASDFCLWSKYYKKAWNVYKRSTHAWGAGSAGSIPNQLFVGVTLAGV